MNKLDNFFKVNFILWGAILLGMIVISAVGYILNSMQAFTPVENIAEYKNIFFLTAIALAIAILMLKRNNFMPQKLASAFSNLPAEEAELKVLAKIRQNFIVVWTLGEAILLIGFVELVLSATIESFLIYLVVSFYSVIMNYPRKDIARQSLNELGTY